MDEVLRQQRREGKTESKSTAVRGTSSRANVFRARGGLSTVRRRRCLRA